MAYLQNLVFVWGIGTNLDSVWGLQANFAECLGGGGGGEQFFLISNLGSFIQWGVHISAHWKGWLKIVGIH